MKEKGWGKGVKNFDCGTPMIYVLFSGLPRKQNATD